MMKLGIEWTQIDNQVALVFDDTAFAAFQLVADERGTDAKYMIVEALARLLGCVVATRTPS